MTQSVVPVHPTVGNTTEEGHVLNPCYQLCGGDYVLVMCLKCVGFGAQIYTVVLMLNWTVGSWNPLYYC